MILGFWNMLTALEFLTMITSTDVFISTYGIFSAVDSHRVVVSGHSRGGHGALTFATHFPDRVLAVVSASGYPDRESYGDANILFDIDLQLSYMDPHLLAIHLSTIHEHDNTQSASNLKHMDLLVRSGSADRTVNPYFQRLIARVFAAEGVNVTYSEKEGADHWYWDFAVPEDGGVVFDPLIRTFIEQHALAGKNNQSSDTNIQMTSRSTSSNNNRNPTFSIVSLNAATFESKNGIQILQMKSRTKKATIHIHSVDRIKCHFYFIPSNVVSFSISNLFWEQWVDFICDTTTNNTNNAAITNDRYNMNENISISIGSSTPITITKPPTANNTHFCYSLYQQSTANSTSDTAGDPVVIKGWHVCDMTTTSTSTSSNQSRIHTKSRQSYEYGPARQVFQSSFLIIVGTKSITSYQTNNANTCTVNNINDDEKDDGDSNNNCQTTHKNETD